MATSIFKISNWKRATVLSVQFLIASAMAASAASSLEGNWRQTHSDAGECATCEVLIEPVTGREGLLLITANNGWTAQIFYDRNASHVAGGVGRWNALIEPAFAGKIFDVGMQNTGDTMSMRLRTKDGSESNWLHASFVRAAASTMSIANTSSKLPSIAEETDLPPLSEVNSFMCDSGTSLTVQYDRRAAEMMAVLNYGLDRTIYLIQVISGSGTRFANDEHEFHTKGGDGVLTLRGETHICKIQ